MPAPPRHLRPATKRWWRHVLAGWHLEQHHLRLLALACVAFDRAESAREILDRDGLLVTSARGGARLHPACRAEEMNARRFERLIQQLDLGDEAPAAAAAPRRAGGAR